MRPERSGLFRFGGGAMKKINDIGIPIGVMAVIGAIIGAFTGGVTGAVQVGASLGIVTMVVVSLYNLVAK
jgi:hypothetical protein